MLYRSLNSFPLFNNHLKQVSSYYFSSVSHRPKTCFLIQAVSKATGQGLPPKQIFNILNGFNVAFVSN